MCPSYMLLKSTTQIIPQSVNCFSYETKKHNDVSGGDIVKCGGLPFLNIPLLSMYKHRLRLLISTVIKVWRSNHTIVLSCDIVTRPWASYQIRNIVGYACAGNAGNVFPHHWLQRKPLVSDPGMHHGTCVTHVPWCMSGSLAPGGGENVPGNPGACAPAVFRIWQEAHAPSPSV